MISIKKAVEHFEFKLDPKNKIWKATKKDVESYNTIMDFVESKHKQQINDHHLFAKLYIMVYAQYLDKYKATVFDDIPQKEMHKLISKPLSYFIELFTRRLNESELYGLFGDLGIDAEKSLLSKSEELKDEETDKIINSLKKEDNLMRFKGKVWDKETVSENLELQINLAINLMK